MWPPVYQTWQVLIISLTVFIVSALLSFSERPNRIGRLPDSCETNVATFLAYTCVRGCNRDKNDKVNHKHDFICYADDYTTESTLHYLIFPQQDSASVHWYTDVTGPRVRCYGHKRANFTILCQNYKYVVAEFRADDLSLVSVYCFFCLFWSDDGLRGHYLISPGNK